VVKKTINAYFRQVTRILDRNDIRWSKPEASIKIENIPFIGAVETLSRQLKGIFDQKWEKLLLAPICSVLASYLAIQFNILTREDFIKDVKKAVILTTEAYLGLVVILIIQVFFKTNKKDFTFQI
jgi:hypothetical protein